MKTQYTFRNGTTLAIRYDGEIVLEEGEHWVTSKDNPHHHFVVNGKGEITKGLGGMRPISEEFIEKLAPATTITWDNGRYVQIGKCVDLYLLGNSWDGERTYNIDGKYIGDKKMPSMALVTPSVATKPKVNTSCRALENFPSKELTGHHTVQAVCEFTEAEQKEIVRRLKSLFKNNAMCMAISPEFLDKAMDTHFANQIELKGSHGVAYLPEVRKELEKEAFGTDLDVPGYERPKYGYLSPKDFSKDSGRQSTYGTAIVQFKDIDEVTYTFGDSVDEFGAHKTLVSGGLVSNPSLAGLPITVGRHYKDMTENPKEKILEALRTSNDACELARKLEIDYVELQYHGQVTADNVKTICYSEGDLPNKERVKQYLDRGIEIKVKTMDGKVIPYKEGIEDRLLNTKEEWRYVNAQINPSWYPTPRWENFTEEQQKRISRRLERLNGNKL